MASVDELPGWGNMPNSSKFTNTSGSTGPVTDNGGELLTLLERKLILFINHVIIDMCICAFGIVGNCINIRVFLRQGLRKSVNMSLFAMSASDLIGLIFQVWQNFCLNPYLEDADLPIQFVEVQFLTGGSPNVLMVRITGWITTYITAERCLSVLLPLRIKQIITFPRTTCILIFLFCVNTAFFLPKAYSNYICWKFYPSLNKTKIGVSYRGNWNEISWVMNMAHFYLTSIAFILVVIFTTTLVIALKKKAKWRHGVTSDRDQREALSTRENRTVGLVVMVAVILIVLYAPGVMCAFLEPLFSDFDVGAKQENLYHVVWSCCFVFHSINASINVIVYYKMSSKYRATLMELFPILKNRIHSDVDESISK